MTVHIEQEKKVREKAKEQGLLVNTIPDILGSMRKVYESVPWFKKRSALKGLEKSEKDPLFAYRRGIGLLYKQSMATIFEFVCFLLFICIVALNL